MAGSRLWFIIDRLPPMPLEELVRAGEELVGWSAHHEFQRGRRHPCLNPYCARNASTGEIRLALSAGTSEATSPDNPSAATAADVTEGLNGFTP